MIEQWRRVWRDGFAPILPTKGLAALREALVADSTELIQGATTVPAPHRCVEDYPCEAADAIGYCGWQGDSLDLETVGEVEEFFARSCCEADQQLGDRGTCCLFLQWFDQAPRDEMRRELLAEVDLELQRRDSFTGEKKCVTNQSSPC